MFYIEDKNNRPLPIPSSNNAPYHYDAEDLKKKTVDDNLAVLLGVSTASLVGMQGGKWADVLYPRILLAAYHLTLSLTCLISEERCDEFIRKFMNKQDPVKFAEAHKTLAATNFFTILLTDDLYNSFNLYEGSKMNNLPSRHRVEMCKFLGIDDKVTFSNACSLLEKLSNNLDHETLILGRLGYLLMWGGMSGQKMIGWFDQKQIT